MVEDKSERPSNPQGRERNRPVLGDITNKVVNRGLGKPLGTRSPPKKTENVNKRAAEVDLVDEENRFWDQVSIVAAELEKKRCFRPKCPKIASEGALSPLKGGKVYHLQGPKGSCSSQGGNVEKEGSSQGRNVEKERSSQGGNVEKGSSSVVKEVKEGLGSALDYIDLEAEEGKVVNVDEEVKERDCVVVEVVEGERSKSCKLSCVERGKEIQFEETRSVPDVVEIDCTQRGVELGDEKDGDKSIGVDDLTAGRAEQVVSSRSVESHERRAFGLQRCSGLKGDGASSLADGHDSLKSCSCSFCIKASYIWADLQYQDVKGRISHLMRSQKEASNLAQRYPSGIDSGRHGVGNTNNITHLETNLTSQWKSLFLNMEGVLASESNQLQSNFLALKDLREEFKMNLESINGLPPDLQQYSSDASDHTLN